jgi:CRISPR-associated protein Csd1
MILQRLAEHYDRIVAEGKVEIAPPGYSVQKISFCVVLEPDGALNSIEDLRRPERDHLRPRDLIVPGQSKPSGSGLNPCLLWDNAEYMLGFTADPNRCTRAKQAFESFREAHLIRETSIGDPAYSSLCRFLRSWTPEQTEDRSEELSDKATHFGVFRLAGSLKYLHEVIRLPELEAKQQGTMAMCLVSGKTAPAARLHEPKIKGVANAQTSGALLVSFNAPAFTSYGKDQSFNAPVSTEIAFKYATALNYLLARRERRVLLGDATIVFWADHANWLEDAFSELISGPAVQNVEEDKRRVDRAHSLLCHLQSGTAHADTSFDGVPTRFFVLGLSPNASRLSVRLWIEEDAAVLETRLHQHLRDFELSSGRDEPPLPLWRVVAATGRATRDASGRLKGFDTTGVSPQLSGDLSRAVLTGGAYPQSLMAAMIRRIRSDGEVAFPRVSAIKACLIRNSRLRGAPMEVPVQLDPQSTDLAYRCGRLFAVLEKAQTESLGDLSSTIKDRYFSSASATPSLVFPRLFRLNGHHIAKMSPSTKVYYERLIGSLMAAPFEFPRRFNLEEQGRFVIGYFQQRQDPFTRKQKAPEEETATV